MNSLLKVMVTGVVRKQYHYTAGTRQVHIDVSDLPPGLYYVVISNGAGMQQRAI